MKFRQISNDASSFIADDRPERPIDPRPDAPAGHARRITLYLIQLWSGIALWVVGAIVNTRHPGRLGTTMVIAGLLTVVVSAFVGPWKDWNGDRH